MTTTKKLMDEDIYRAAILKAHALGAARPSAARALRVRDRLQLMKPPPPRRMREGRPPLAHATPAIARRNVK